MHRTVAFWLRLVAFLLLAAAVLCYTCYVLTPKDDFGICSMLNLYRQERNTVDVLTLGSSVAYCGVNTNVLWNEYGIASYNLCSAEQPFWISYYYLEEALRLQTPKLIIVDAKAAIYQQEYSKRGRTIMGTYGILSPVTRLNAIAASVKPEDVLSFALGFAQVHSGYPKLEAADFRFPPDNGGRGRDWKGFIEMDAHEQHEKPSLVWTQIKQPLSKKQEAYFVMICELAKEKGIPVLVVGFPNPDYASEHMYYNSLFALAGEHLADSINYNDPQLRFGLRYTTDFADWQHLNVKGSVTFTRKLGKDLMAGYGLADRRDDPRFLSYQRCAENWFKKYPQTEWNGKGQ